VDNQHRRISGYRELTEAEIAAMNEAKAMGNAIGGLLDRMKELPGVDQRALAIARTELQTGIMWAVRAVARPDGF
jgi:hypothetical protein